MRKARRPSSERGNDVATPTEVTILVRFEHEVDETELTQLIEDRYEDANVLEVETEFC